MMMTGQDTSRWWKQMMDLGLFDDSYPQRLNAAFHYLSTSDSTGVYTFTLKVKMQIIG